jgi:hypothetical protein
MDNAEEELGTEQMGGLGCRLYHNASKRKSTAKVVLLNYVFSLRIVAIYRAPHWTPLSATRRGVRRQAVARSRGGPQRQGTSGSATC